MISYTRDHAGAPGHNSYGVPLHACNGYRADEHYWKWLEFKRITKNDQDQIHTVQPSGPECKMPVAALHDGAGAHH